MTAPDASASNAPHAASPGGASLSRDMAELLIELSIALHKHAIYPEGHPLLASAEDRVSLRLRPLVEERGSLAIGVARRQLVIEGVATDPANALLRELAQKLHNNYLGAVRFYRGVTTPELASLLRTLAVDPSRMPTPLGLGSPDILAQWEHVRLYPLTYGSLELVEDVPEEGAERVEERREAQDARTRAAQLWIGLARAALLDDGAKVDADESAPANDPVVVAQAIDANAREVAYDQVIVGYLLQIADELKADATGDAGVLRKRVSRMLGALRPETLRRLLKMGGNDAQRRKFVLDAAQGMAVDAVVELVKAAAESNEQSISHSLVRLLSKLALHAEQDALPDVRGRAETELRDHVTQLMSGWELEDPNPDAYRMVLEGMSRETQASPDLQAMNTCEPDRVVAMALEVETTGPGVWRAIDEMTARGRLVAVLDLVERVPVTNEAAHAIWDRMRDDRHLERLLDDGRIDFAALERIAARWGAHVGGPLITALARSKDRTTRRKLLDLIAEMGPRVAPQLIERLEGTPWYVQRNMLVILGRLDPAELPADFNPLGKLSHEDARVRREAAKLLLRMPARREQALLTAIADPDPGVAGIVLSAALESCPPGAALVVKNRAADRALPPEVRAMAIRVYAGSGGRDVADWLLARALAGKTVFGKPKLAPKSPEMLAALGGLAAHWRTDARAIPALRTAFDSSDPEIRAAVMPTQRAPARSGGNARSGR
ncbi:MAG TPA: hypothetical protein VFZ11_13665 [Gemmatimonadaceae bacterium]